MKNFKRKKLTDKDWKEIAKLPFAERYIRRISNNKNDKRKYLIDKVTGEIHSQDRMAKKEIRDTLLKPTGRQLRKEKRYLRSLKIQNDEPTKTGELVNDIPGVDNSTNAG